MNIQIQIAALIVNVLLLIFYKSHKTLHLYKERNFEKLLWISLVSLFLDISSIIAIRYRDRMPLLFVEFVCKTYIISLLDWAWGAFLYTLSYMYSRNDHKKVFTFSSIPTLAIAIIVYFLPIEIFEEGRIVYTYGMADYAIYGSCFMYLSFSILLAIKFFKVFNYRMGIATISWISLYIICAAVQFFVPQLLLVGFSGTMGMLVIYVLIENPEASLNMKYGCFNSYALTEYIDDLIINNDEFHLCEMTTGNISLNVFKEALSSSVVLKEIKMLNKYKDVKVFRHSEHGFITISNNEKHIFETKELATNIIKEFDISTDKVYFTYIKNPQKFINSHNVLKYLSSKKDSEFIDHNLYVSDSMIDEFNLIDEISNEIDLALEEDRIEVFYQPIFSIETNNFPIAEALVRLRKLDGSLMSPGIFIPVAEETGQIVALGERVFEKVCTFFESNDYEKLHIKSISVNLSIVQCEENNICEKFSDIQRKHNVDPGLVKFEITETSSAKSHNTIVSNMECLKSKGFLFALDDFGKGESNLDYVISMPLSIVKIDFDLTKSYFKNDKAKLVVNAIVQMAHSLKLHIVAEGVETKEELDGMLNEGIDFIQGYYFSKPVPEKDYIKFLEERNK